MDLEKLLEMQKILDDHIIKQNGLEGQDLFPNTVLALQVELAEFANEGRWFKHWSDKKEPKNGYDALIDCPKCQGRGFWFSGQRVLCGKCNQTGKITNPLLEEFVDGVHFFLSIANQKGWQEMLYIYKEAIDDAREEGFDGGITGIFLEMLYFLNKCQMEGEANPETDGFQRIADLMGVSRKAYLFRTAWALFITIGLVGFGFTLEQIEKAYMDKNAVNHQRQDQGY